MGLGAGRRRRMVVQRLARAERRWAGSTTTAAVWASPSVREGWSWRGFGLGRQLAAGICLEPSLGAFGASCLLLGAPAWLWWPGLRRLVLGNLGAVDGRVMVADRADSGGPARSVLAAAWAVVS